MTLFTASKKSFSVTCVPQGAGHKGWLPPTPRWTHAPSSAPTAPGGSPAPCLHVSQPPLLLPPKRTHNPAQPSTHRLPPRADGVHPRLCAHAAQVGPRRVGAQAGQQLKPDVALAAHGPRVDLRRRHVAWGLSARV